MAVRETTTFTGKEDEEQPDGDPEGEFVELDQDANQEREEREKGGREKRRDKEDRAAWWRSNHLSSERSPTPDYAESGSEGRHRCDCRWKEALSADG